MTQHDRGYPGVPPALDSLFDQVSQKFDQTEAEYVIHELKRLCPTVKDFDQTDLKGAFQNVYKQGAIDDGNPKLMAILSKKTSKKDEILNLISDYEETSPQKHVLVGRDADVSNIIQLLTNPQVPGVNLFGDSGVGKTTLAKEVSMKIEKDFKPFLIDLRGTKDINAVYFKVLQMFKLTPWDYSKERIYIHLRHLTIKTLLILDNVEQFLSNEKEDAQKKRKEFLEFLRIMLSSEASKRGCLKVILTSKIQTGDSFLKYIHFEEHELLPLTSKHSRMLMGWRLGAGIDVKQEKALIEIGDLCRNTPYLLERAKQLLRQGFSKPSEVLQKLNTLKHKGVPEQFACISELFESLPNDEIRQVAVKISLLQRPFSVSTAIKITGISDYDAELDLELLAVHRIIAAEDVNGERKYDLHDLFREFVTSYLCKEEPFYEKAYAKAENQFVDHFSKILTQHAKNLDEDFVGTYKELEEDKANFQLSIDLITRKEAFDLILQSEDVKETASVAMVFETFKSIIERRKLFGEWAKIAEKKENWLSCAIFRCWESVQLADMEGTQNARETLKRAQMSLAKAMLILTPEQIKAAKGLYKYCSGRIKCMSSANLIDKSSKEEKKRLLEQALFDLKQSLAIHKEIYGDHTLTARTLNLIGNCYMERGEPKEALESYQQAMSMKIKVVGSEKHFDIPTYYNQLSQVYEALGKKETPSSSLFQKNYQMAVSFINKALGLQKELGVNDTVETATFQRNIANILIGLEEYDQALEYAQNSFKIRSFHLRKHPETVRILYLIGVIHEKREDLEAALQNYEEAFAMEESLHDNHSVVRKRLCSKLEGLCNDLGEEDKLKTYGPRMEKIRKETDVDAAKKADDDAAGAEEGTDFITLDNKGGYYDFSSYYFFLEVPCNAVDTPVKVRYKVDPCRCQPPMAGITTSVSYFLQMSSSMTVELNEPITVTLIHSGPGKEYGYETTAMAFNQDKDVWENLPDLMGGSQVSNLGRYKTDSIRVQISKLTILAVVTRLITDRFQVTPKGCVIRSSVCHDVTVEFPEGAVDKTVEGTMKLLVITQRRSLPEHGNYGYQCPILLVDGFDNVRIQKMVTITMPHPCPEEYPLERVKIMRLSNEPEKVIENNWEDITDQILHLKQMKKDQQCFIEFQVQHFSRYWVVDKTLETLENIYRNLISSPPSYVRVGLFKMIDEARKSISKLRAFKVFLRCVANINDKQMKEMKETHEELAVETSVNPMRPGDRALVKIQGDFEEKGPINEQEKPIVVFLGDEKYDTELDVCRKREETALNENDRNRGLIISLYKEIDKCFLCKLSTGETEDLEEILCHHEVYKIRKTPPRGYFVIINVNKFDPSTRLEERRGSDQDVQNLESVFKDLDFEVNLLCNDPKAQEILNFIYQVSEKDFSDYSCFGLCIMSHGADNGFCGSDGERITWSTVLAFFYRKPTLKDKPKMFLFQACRNAGNTELNRGDEHDTPSTGHGRGGERERRDEPTGSESRTRPSTGISSSRITYLPSDVPDTLVVHSCFQGHGSFRNAQDGTFFIKSFVRVLRENVNIEHMADMITMVTNELTSQLGNKQVPEMRSTLTKKLYFKPEMKFRHFYE